MKKPTVVYRGVSHKVEHKVGEVFSSHGYTSTSSSKEIAKSFAENGDGGAEVWTTYKIRVPAGRRAAKLTTEFGAEEGLREKELLFARGSSFKVLKVGKDYTEVELM